MTNRIKSLQFAKLILLTIIALVVFQDSIACSGYKITIGNRTFFGSNHDAWFTTPHIWLTTWSQGVYKYDGKTITNYKVIEDKKEVNLISMYKDKQGNLWLGTPDNGVFKFNGDTFEKYIPK